jgi:hypothetical protein
MPRRAAFTATAAVAALLASAAHAGAAEIARSAGETHATLVYRPLQHLGPGDDSFADAHVRISRGGEQAFAERVPLHPRLAPGTPVRGQTRTFAVRDLDGDGEPEVILELDSAGAHCCAWTRVYRWDAAAGTYAPAGHFWGNASSRPTLADTDADGRPEFASTDDRFAYDFNGYAGSVRPIQIWSYARGVFRDVTREHTHVLRRDAACLWRLYVEDRRSLPGSARGLLPAWAAELYLLGEGARADRELQNAARRGYLLPAVDGRAIPRRTSRPSSGCSAAPATSRAEARSLWTRSHRVGAVLSQTCDGFADSLDGVWGGWWEPKRLG